MTLDHGSPTELIDESDLPLPSAEFADRMVAEIDAYIDHHGLDEARFESDLSEAEIREGLYTRIFNEIQAVDHPRGMLHEAEDPQLFVHLLKQMEDEAKHARMLSQRLWNPGGEPRAVFDRVEDSTREFRELFDQREGIVEEAGVLQSGAERTAQYRHPKELVHYDDATARIYEDVIVPEEKFHAKIDKNVFQTHCASGESQLRAVESARDGREEIRSYHDEGVTDAYETSSEAD